MATAKDTREVQVILAIVVSVSISAGDVSDRLHPALSPTGGLLSLLYTFNQHRLETITDRVYSLARIIHTPGAYATMVKVGYTALSQGAESYLPPGGR